MRLLTFNLWHGLSPSSPVLFEALEPTARRRWREELQLQLFEKLDPDIGFFQEVNPAASRVEAFRERLGWNAEYQPDLVGLKVLGVGIPANLNSGLVTATKKDWRQTWVDAISLSRPGMNLVRRWASWQLKEERFALFSETLLPKWGKVLAVNTHLHHGIEATEEFLADFEKLRVDLELPDAMVSEMKDRIVAGNERRARELSVLLGHLKRLERRYEAVIMAGDFNARPNSEICNRLREMGFIDAWAKANGDLPGHTFDRERNSANHLLQRGFPLSLVIEDLSFSAKIRDQLLAAAWDHEMRPRRIDYLWIKTRNIEIQVNKAELVGLPDQEGMAPSDHFGVYAEVEPR
ncbi:MAG TPA: endonuclease/exonuclease/phosphatase family protein [Bdellovibrionales bacterium]|nr:endonuclease/exonuclease/phosphatase family protein [Bdellovibrionales bacterium]